MTKKQARMFLARRRRHLNDRIDAREDATLDSYDREEVSALGLAIIALERWEQQERVESDQ